jgi:hypothetical protein
MLMGDMPAMTLINKHKISLLFALIFVLSSCESLNDVLGLSKSQIDDSLYSETPELILPPDFDKEPKPLKNVRQEKVEQQNFQPMTTYPTVNPRITNYFSPKINVESSSSPSDSLERFKQNKRFTVGEWVYSQYVDGFKRGNLYYRPIYDKGYNFSRRYVPNRNVASFQTPPPQYNFQENFPINNLPSEEPPSQNEFDTLDQLPVLE